MSSSGDGLGSWDLKGGPETQTWEGDRASGRGTLSWGQQGRLWAREVGRGNWEEEGAGGTGQGPGSGCLARAPELLPPFPAASRGHWLCVCVTPGAMGGGCVCRGVYVSWGCR